MSDNSTDLTEVRGCSQSHWCLQGWSLLASLMEKPFPCLFELVEAPVFLAYNLSIHLQSSPLQFLFLSLSHGLLSLCHLWFPWWLRW